MAAASRKYRARTNVRRNTSHRSSLIDILPPCSHCCSASCSPPPYASSSTSSFARRLHTASLTRTTPARRATEGNASRSWCRTAHCRTLGSPDRCALRVHDASTNREERRRSFPTRRHVTIPAMSHLWRAELARVEATDTTELWVRAATEFDQLTWPHDAACCRWRAARVALWTGEGTRATRLLKRAAAESRTRVPLSEAIAATARGRQLAARMPAGWSAHHKGTFPPPAGRSRADRRNFRHRTGGSWREADCKPFLPSEQKS